MQAIDDVPEVAVWIDEGDEGYAFRWPRNWHIHDNQGAPLELTAAMNGLMARYPGRKFYGHFSDHFRPLTRWSKRLEEAAGDHFMAWPEDNYVAWYQVAAAPCWGGDLARAMGWLFLPCTLHYATEQPWLMLWEQLNIGRCVRDVVCTRGDGVPPPYRKVTPAMKLDGQAFDYWRHFESEAWLKGVRDRLRAAGLTFDGDRVAPVYGQTEAPRYRGPWKPRPLAAPAR